LPTSPRLLLGTIFHFVADGGHPISCHHTQGGRHPRSASIVAA
jgi:hypothetical protein